jgi:hypothetical protein
LKTLTISDSEPPDTQIVNESSGWVLCVFQGLASKQTLMHAILKYFPKFGGSAEEAAI